MSIAHVHCNCSTDVLHCTQIQSLKVKRLGLADLLKEKFSMGRRGVQLIKYGLCREMSFLKDIKLK